MSYTVKQLADLAGVSPRTLHYYDQIGLLSPSSYGDNGYRRYDGDAVLRLQQILFFRELDFSLAELREIIDGPAFDRLHALQTHRRALEGRIGRLNELIRTIDQTVLHLKGTITMEPSDMFSGFDEAQQERYEQEVAQKYGESRLKESKRRWGGYSAERRAEIMAEGGAIYLDLAGMIGRDPADPDVQAAVARWHQHIRHFYEPTAAILRGLGQGYAEDPAFAAFYQRIHPELPGFLRAAITHYCDTGAFDDED
ncbi:MAG TPA: MerR family transcriptional regulator [Herpetosiphonaceae bacterium]|nr:MerR family transcriptional regulator [Herpetosiphonaceae bacterium]